MKTDCSKRSYKYLKMHCHTCNFLGKYKEFKFIGIDLAICPKCGSKTGDCNTL